MKNTKIRTRIVCLTSLCSNHLLCGGAPLKSKLLPTHFLTRGRSLSKASLCFICIYLPPRQVGIVSSRFVLGYSEKSPYRRDARTPAGGALIAASRAWFCPIERRVWRLHQEHRALGLPMVINPAVHFVAKMW